MSSAIDTGESRPRGRSRGGDAAVDQAAVDTLIRFARLAAGQRCGPGILPLLSDALVEHAGADSVALLLIDEKGEAAFFPSRHLPEELEGLTIEIDGIGDTNERKLLNACKGRFARVVARPLVSDGDLFGIVEMLFTDSAPADRIKLAEGLIDLAGIELGTTAKLLEIARSHASIRASNEALAKTEKVRALGQMAAGVSHDVRNILHPLSMYTELIARAADDGDLGSVTECVDEMKQVLVRGMQTLERLREYSRQKPESRTEQLDLNHLAREATEIARPRMVGRKGRMSRIDFELGSVEPVMGRSGEVVSALVNLVVNAIDALPDGGTIALRTGVADGGSWVAVVDDGPGMPPDVEARAFDPFFTTKGTEGTGLGLAMVYACMQRHDGFVKLETEPSKGTTFLLWFPIDDCAKSSRR